MNSPPAPISNLPRRIVSILTGNAIQISGLALGVLLLWICAQPFSRGIRVSSMVAGYLLIYFNSHSIVHYSVGRLAGIHFRHYSIGGSAHAAAYPPGMRAIFQRLPFFRVHTEPASMKAARPYSKALMFAAGILGTAAGCTAAALYALRADAPGGTILLVFNLIWLASSLLAETRPSGDLGKAFNIIKGT